MDRRHFSLLLGSGCLLGLMVLTVNTSPVMDELGCLVDDASGAYKCEAGPLAGREFVSKNEALEELDSLKRPGRPKVMDRGEKGETVEEAAPPAPPPDLSPKLIVMSWNAKSIAHDDSDYDRAALVLNDADLVVLQDVETAAQGKGFLNVIATLMELKGHQKICRGWVQRSDGTRLRYGYLWKEKSLGWLDSRGLLHEECSSNAVILTQDKRVKNGSHALFFAKSVRRIFSLSTLATEKKSQAWAHEVLAFLHAMPNGPWPALVALDLKVSTRDAGWAEVRKEGYVPALSSDKRSGAKSDENFWTHRADIESSGTVNLLRRFADVRPEDIERGLSKRFPIAIELRLGDESPKEMSTRLVSRTKKKAEPQVKVMKVKPPTTKLVAPPPENLEEEESHADKLVGGDD